MEMGTTTDVDSAFDDFEGELPDAVDEAAIERMRTVARVLDEGVRLPGTDFRFGVDPIVGILPGAGDAVTSAVSLYIVFEAARMGVSRPTLVRMLTNVAVDLVGGSVPLLGVVFDAFWKANKWNVELALEDLGSSGGGERDEGPVTVGVE